MKGKLEAKYYALCINFDAPPDQVSIYFHKFKKQKPGERWGQFGSKDLLSRVRCLDDEGEKGVDELDSVANVSTVPFQRGEQRKAVMLNVIRPLVRAESVGHHGELRDPKMSGALLDHQSRRGSRSHSNSPSPASSLRNSVTVGV